MKLSLYITKEAGGWKIEYHYNGAVHKSLPPRKLLRVGNAEQGFPLPPKEEADNWKGKTHEQLCAPNGDIKVIEDLLRKVIYTDPQSSDIKDLGNYLSTVLFGTNWIQVCALAQPNETIELELFIAPDDVDLQRLPWEMMYESDVPFSALKERDVSIARIVKNKKAAKKTKTITLTLPLKVLFVIGRKLDNALRPGAEYLGLLRQMKIRFKDGERNRHLNIKVLTEATWNELKEAVEHFQPSVVHFISHGDEKGRLLLSQRDEQTKELLEEPDYCDAAKLLEAMRSSKPPHNVPPIVVLNACHTSDADVEANESYRSMAARLVEGGVSVAIGMTGEVADGACRLFTRRFYQALVTENPIDISISTSRGRRAAMLFYVSKDETFYENHIEWARPTLFLADNVSFSLESDAAACVRAEAPQKFIPDGTTFCDRLSYLQHYQKFCRGSKSPEYGKLLLFSVDVPDNNTEQYGKTRLLRELAAHTLLDGLIPCPVFSGKSFEPPQNLLLFGLKLADEMNEIRKTFEVDERKSSNMLLALSNLLNEQLPDSSQGSLFTAKKVKLIQQALGMNIEPQIKEAIIEIVREALLEDFKLLKQDLCKMGLSSPIVVLLDDIHRYDGVTAELLNGKFFTEYGLGDKDTPVLVVATYSKKGEQTNARRDIEDFLKDFKSRVYADGAIELQPITEAEEARLAYTQYLLSRDEPLAVNTRKNKDAEVNNLFTLLHKYIKGVPNLFSNPMLKPLLEFAVNQNVLLEANDELIYEALDKKGEDK